MKACCPLVPCPPGAMVALPMPIPVPTSVTSGFADATLCRCGWRLNVEL